MVSEGYFKRKCASLHKFPQGTLFLYKEKKTDTENIAEFEHEKAFLAAKEGNGIQRNQCISR